MDDPGKAAESLGPITTFDLLAELGRRFRLRYGRLEIVFHDGRPSPKVTVEHRVLCAVEEHEK